MLDIPTELILGKVTQDSGQGRPFESADAWNGGLVVLNEPLKVFYRFGALCILYEVSNFLLLDLGHGD